MALLHKNLIKGVSMWNTLSNNESSLRKEIVHNIDPIWNVSAIRSDNWKLIQGLVFPNWSGWYPPFGSEDNEAPDEDIRSLRDKDRTSCLSRLVLSQLNRTANYDHLRDSVIDCGLKPANASVNCDPKHDLCLFDVSADPCEYNNVADSYPQVVSRLWNKLIEMNRTSAQPANRPSDPYCDPKLHNYSWSCWRD